MARKKGSSKKKAGGAGGASSSGAAASGSSTPPNSSSALALNIIAPAAFWNAVSEDECPADLDVDFEASPSPESATGTIAASSIADLLNWFAKGAAAPDAGAARLDFAASLSKDERAAVHSTIADAGLTAALESASDGVGEQRKLTVYKKGSAPAKPIPSPELLDRAATLYKWARDSGLVSYSRDEIAEQLAAGPDGSGLAAPLAALWAARSAEQTDVAALAKLVGADDAAGVGALLKSKPGLVGTVDSATGQPPLHAAARLGSASALRALVAAGAELEDKDAHGRTALSVARTFEQCDAEAALLQLGAHDPEAGKFPMNTAAADLATKATSAAAMLVSAVGGAATAVKEAVVAEATKAAAVVTAAMEDVKPKEEEAPKPAKAPKVAEPEVPKPAAAEVPKPAAAEVPKPAAEAVKAVAEVLTPVVEAPKPVAEAPKPEAEAPKATASTPLAAAVASVVPAASTAVAAATEALKGISAAATRAAAPVAAAVATATAAAEDGPSAPSTPVAAAATPIAATPAVAESPAAAGTAAAGTVAAAGVTNSLKNMVSESKAWATAHRGFTLYAGATAVAAGLTMAVLAVRRRN